MGLNMSMMQALKADANMERNLLFYVGEGHIMSVEQLLEGHADMVHLVIKLDN